MLSFGKYIYKTVQEIKLKWNSIKGGHALNIHSHEIFKTNQQKIVNNFEKLTTILSLNNRIMYQVSVLKTKEHHL